MRQFSLSPPHVEGRGYLGENSLCPTDRSDFLEWVYLITQKYDVSHSMSNDYSGAHIVILHYG